WIGIGASALISFVILFIVLNHSGHRAAALATAGHPIDQGTLDLMPRGAADFPAESVHWFDWIIAGGDTPKVPHHATAEGHPSPTLADVDGTTHKLPPFYVQA